jgi:hypothetical protein
VGSYETCIWIIVLAAIIFLLLQLAFSATWEARCRLYRLAPFAQPNEEVHGDGNEMVYVAGFSSSTIGLLTTILNS